MTEHICHVCHEDCAPRLTITVDGRDLPLCQACVELAAIKLIVQRTPPGPWTMPLLDRIIAASAPEPRPSAVRIINRDDLSALTRKELARAIRRATATPPPAVVSH
jgi:hypothetical protein